MRIKNIVDEDFINYKDPSMFIFTIHCSGKCCIEQNVSFDICQNHEWQTCSIIDMSDDKIIDRYLNNHITKAIIFGGLEPFDQFEELKNFIHKFRVTYGCQDVIVIYTGYNKEEIDSEISSLSDYKNIIVKFGRYKINSNKVYDEVLGVTLASENQFAEMI